MIRLLSFLFAKVLIKSFVQFDLDPTGKSISKYRDDRSLEAGNLGGILLSIWKYRAFNGLHWSEDICCQHFLIGCKHSCNSFRKSRTISVTVEEANHFALKVAFAAPKVPARKISLTWPPPNRLIAAVSKASWNIWIKCKRTFFWRDFVVTPPWMV
jgi:hypothetical protein